jgi:hypothetical protein
MELKKSRKYLFTILSSALVISGMGFLSICDDRENIYIQASQHLANYELEEAKTATIKEEYSKLNGKWIKIIHAAYDYNPTPEELDRYQVSYALIDAIDCVNEITSDCNSVCAKVLVEIKIFNNTIFNHRVKDKDFTPTVEFYSNHYTELSKEDVINELDVYNAKYTEYVSGIKDLINKDLNVREVPNLGVTHGNS